jgi:hypothetical protein
MDCMSVPHVLSVVLTPLPINRYQVYMSLNLARHQQRTQHLPPPQERVLPPEAKGVKLRPMSIDDLAAVHDLGERVYDRHLYPNLYRIW